MDMDTSVLKTNKVHLILLVAGRYRSWQESEIYPYNLRIDIGSSMFSQHQCDGRRALYPQRAKVKRELIRLEFLISFQLDSSR